jgi:hypothetical protein
LTGYDSNGSKLLHKIYRHGTNFAAKTAQSLVFLSEIAQRPRRAPVVPLPASDTRRKGPISHVSAIASGQ